MVKNYKKNAISLAKVLEKKQAKDTIILDIKEISIIADYFIISTTQSSAHCKALINTILEKVRENGHKKTLNYEGNENTGWVLLDCGAIVVHLFSEEKHNYYHLEQLWQEAKRITSWK